jgi:hypothetical protein
VWVSHHLFLVVLPFRVVVLDLGCMHPWEYKISSRSCEICQMSRACEICQMSRACEICQMSRACEICQMSRACEIC